MSPPSWLTKEYIENTLQQDGSNIKVSNIEVTNAISEGNNYLSKIFRVKVLFTSKNESQTKLLIIKAPLDCNGGLSKELLDKGVGRNEVRIYNEYLPKINTILNLYDEESITPESYPIDKDDVLILEDLVHSGYILVDRLKQLDFDHCVVALKTLAKFHATASIMHDGEPEFVEDIGRDLFFRESEESSELCKFVVTAFHLLSEEVESELRHDNISKRLYDISKTLWKSLQDILRTDPDEFTVLAHGDYSLTNMMFKYNDQGIPQSIKILDLQASQYTSPAIDILHFFNGSVQEDIRISKKDELLEIYLTELNDNLLKFGSTRHFSREELNKHLKKLKLYGLLVSVITLPLILADTKQCTIVKLDNDVSTTDSNNPIRSYYKNALYKNVIIKRLVSEFEENGWF